VLHLNLVDVNDASRKRYVYCNDRIWLMGNMQANRIYVLMRQKTSVAGM